MRSSPAALLVIVHQWSLQLICLMQTYRFRGSSPSLTCWCPRFSLERLLSLPRSSTSSQMQRHNGADGSSKLPADVGGGSSRVRDLDQILQTSEEERLERSGERGPSSETPSRLHRSACVCVKGQKRTPFLPQLSAVRWDFSDITVIKCC